MPKHVNGQICELCSEKLSGVCEPLKEWFEKVKVQFPDVHISWGFRDQIDQQKAYVDGLSHRQYPDSAHNHTKDGKPYSLAIDVFQLNQDNRAVFDAGFYRELNEQNIANSEPIIWGGTFKDIKDLDHYQIDASKLKI